MKSVLFFLPFVLLGFLLSQAIPVFAHHSFSAEFDSAKPITLRGYVTKIEWTNPHAWFYIDVSRLDGPTENWGFELGPPHLLQGTGWTRDTMKLGDFVIVAGTRAKNGSNRVNARNVTVNGTKLGTASSERQQ